MDKGIKFKCERYISADTQWDNEYFFVKCEFEKSKEESDSKVKKEK